MRRHQAFGSSFLRTEDLNGEDLTVTIDTIEMQEIRNPDGGGTEGKPVLKFLDYPKSVILNNINWTSIETAYGPESDDWYGKAIVIFPTQTQFGNRVVPCMRIRVPEAAPKETVPPPTDADAPATEDCVF
jgi:hypothetical protein